MVSNYDRIAREIEREAERISLDNGLHSESLVELVMEIVDAEDRHRVKPYSVDREISNLIANGANVLIAD